jgi:hypothetical protein
MSSPSAKPLEQRLRFDVDRPRSPSAEANVRSLTTKRLAGDQRMGPHSAQLRAFRQNVTIVIGKAACTCTSKNYKTRCPN